MPVIELPFSIIAVSILIDKKYQHKLNSSEIFLKADSHCILVVPCPMLYRPSNDLASSCNEEAISSSIN